MLVPVFLTSLTGPLTLIVPLSFLVVLAVLVASRVVAALVVALVVVVSTSLPIVALLSAPVTYPYLAIVLP